MIEELIVERERLWAQHPIICEAAVLPSTSVQNAVWAVIEGARKTRFSYASWADPVTGKSRCLTAIENFIRQEHPGSGVLRYEAMREESSAEGRLLEDILLQMAIAAPIARSLAGKRDQLTRALLALAGVDMHLYMLIDEAQELHIRELNWLKGVINKVILKQVKVTVVLMGQKQLLDRIDELKAAGRQDLLERFFKRVVEFKGCRTVEDLATLCEAMDIKSEYPEGSGWSYTMFLFPRAYENGLRLQAKAQVLWQAFTALRSASEVQRGIPMEAISSYLAQICLLHKDLDSADMELDLGLLEEAAKETLS